MKLSQRQMEAVNCRDSLCLSAGAGTGKTMTLVAKYMDYLDRVDSSKNILALTFTDKAAAEMRARVRKALTDKGGNNVDERLEDLSWSTIQTFHAFCAQIIRDFPLETGVDPNFVLIEDAQMNLFINDAARKVLASTDPAIMDALNKAMASVGVKRVPHLFKKLYKKRFLTGPYLEKMLEGDTEALIKQASEDLIMDAWWLLSTEPKVKVYLQDLRKLALKHPDEDYLSSVASDLEMLCNHPQPAEGGRAMKHTFDALPMRYSGSAVLQDDKVEFKGLMKNLKEERDKYRKKGVFAGNDPELNGKVIEFFTALRTVNSAFISEISRLKRERNGIDYDDMLHTVHQLFLKDPEFVGKYFSSRYKYILIDETQDTDQIQLDIVKAILGNECVKSDRLFVVGDPKQSIYFFRDVDVSLYKDTREYIQERLEGTYLPLDLNHRSAPQIVSLVNAVFEKVMTSSARSWEFMYESVGVTEKRKEHKGSAELPSRTGSFTGSTRLIPVMIRWSLARVMATYISRWNSASFFKRFCSWICFITASGWRSRVDGLTTLTPMPSFLSTSTVSVSVTLGLLSISGMMTMGHSSPLAAWTVMIRTASAPSSTWAPPSLLSSSMLFCKLTTASDRVRNPEACMPLRLSLSMLRLAFISSPLANPP